jgi:hypothetical protein
MGGRVVVAGPPIAAQRRRIVDTFRPRSRRAEIGRYGRRRRRGGSLGMIRDNE